MKIGKRIIDVTSEAFLAGYHAGIEHPDFVIGNTLKKAPDCSELNPYQKDTEDYEIFKLGFSAGIL